MQAITRIFACKQAPTWLLLLLFPAVISFAQSVRWDPPGGQLGFNQVSELSLTFTDCEPELDKLKLPAVDGLVFGQPSQSSSMSIVNFSSTKTFALVFPIRATKRAPIEIPAFDVTTDKGALHVVGARFSVGDATVGSSGLALDDISAARISLGKTTLWAGEVVPVTYTLSVVKRYFHSLASAVDWQPAPLVIEEWTKPEPSEIMLRGERRLVATQTTRGYVKSPGTYSLKPANQLANLVVGTSGFGFFTTPTVEQRALSSEPVEVTVRPLPPAPAGFTGAVGQFTLISKVVPTSAAVGDPVTWTLELAGTGNWPDISGLPQREVSNDFQVVQPKSKRKMKDNSLFEGSVAEDVVLVPTKAGTYTLGSVRFSYFDTNSGTDRTITTEPVTLNVGPGAAAPAAPTTTGPVQSSLGPQPQAQPSAPTLPTPVSPTPPENLPRDPLAESDQGFIPLTTPPLLLACVLAVALLPLTVWFILAGARSRALDPQRRRREARQQLVALLAELRTASPSARPELLRQWQAGAAALWVIPHAAPGSPLVHASVTPHAPAAASDWTALWDEADRALHGRDGILPDDWAARAESALRSVKVPSWSPFSLFAPRHLLPFLFVLTFCLLPVGLRADGPSDAYRRGDFAAAEAGWKSLAAAHSGDWALRHNLGLALAQQDRWPEAAAQWAGAFLLNPRSDATRWDLALGLQRSGLAPADLVDFSRGEGRQALARSASPAEWQFALVGASLLIALAFVLLLYRGYGKIGGWARPAALVTILLAILLAAAATFSLRTYGQLAEPGVVMVWRASTLRSIPTEADTTQKVSPLSAGSIAVADRSFLDGWTHLVFVGGQSGWVRTADVARLYK